MTPHFKAAELACKCGCGMLPEVDFMWTVERLRVRAGFPFPVTSGARCPAHNAKESGTGEDGPHTTGRSIDVALIGYRAFVVIEFALELGFTGIGIKQHGPASGRLVHLDDLPATERRPRPWVWTYP